MKLSIAFSTCPNDTFIFDALVNKKIDTQDIEFEVFMADVEDLNQQAFSSRFDITKMSFHAYAYAAENYRIMNSGSALGQNCGPLLISKNPVDIAEVEKLKIAIPGKYTTANLLLGIAFPKAQNKISYLFSEIEDAIMSGKVDVGVIIHENRFTYQASGLQKIMDLGQYWEESTQCSIPLGCIAIQRRIPEEIQNKVDALIRQSIEYAFTNPQCSRNYVRKFAQKIEDSIIQQHIDLYVNKYSINLGVEGKNSIRTLFEKATQIKNFPKLTDLEIFL